MTATTISLDLTGDQAAALAQFVKRCGWQEWRQNASTDEEASMMREAFAKLAKALADRGDIPMKCPACGAAELTHDVRDLAYAYKGNSAVIALVTGDFCPACDESILDIAESDRVMREMRTAHTHLLK